MTTGRRIVMELSEEDVVHVVDVLRAVSFGVHWRDFPWKHYRATPKASREATYELADRLDRLLVEHRALEDAK